jgi:hypothetical protein
MLKRFNGINYVLCFDTLRIIFKQLYMYECLIFRRVCTAWNKLINQIFDKKILKEKDFIKNLLLGNNDNSYDKQRFINLTFKFDINLLNIKELRRIIIYKDFACQTCSNMMMKKNFESYIMNRPFKFFKLSMHCCGFSFRYCCNVMKICYKSKYCKRICGVCFRNVCNSCNLYKCYCCERTCCVKDMFNCLLCNKDSCTCCTFECRNCKKCINFCFNCVKKTFIHSCPICHGKWFNFNDYEKLYLICKDTNFEKYKKSFY